MKRSWLALAALLHAVLGVTPSVKLEVINQSPQKLGIFVGSHKAHYVSPYSIGVFGVLKGIPFKVYTTSGISVVNGTANTTNQDGVSVAVWQSAFGGFQTFSAESSFSVSLNDGMDTARLRVLNFLNSSLYVNGVTSNCWSCRRPNLCVLPSHTLPSSMVCPTATVRGGYIIIDNRHDYIIEIAESLNHRNVIYQAVLSNLEYSVTTLLVLPPARNGTLPVIAVAPQYSGKHNWIPLVATFALLVGLNLAYRLFKFLYRHTTKQDDEDDDLSEQRDFIVKGKSVSLRPRIGNRIMAVDAFRGFVVCLGVFVNYGGGGYWYFNYSRWNGLTFADLVFPWLLFVMGLSTTLSLHAQRRKLAKRFQMTGKVIFRCIRLFALGLFMNNGRDLGNWRVTGILQYHAFAHLVVGLVDLFIRYRPSNRENHQREAEALQEMVAEGYVKLSDGSPTAPVSPAVKWLRDVWSELKEAFLVDIAPFRFQFLFMACLMTLYLTLEYLLAVPGCPRGYIGPGGLALPPNQAHCTGGVHRYVDLKIWGSHHMLHALAPGSNLPVSAATCADTYSCDVFDPEGTLGILSVIVLTFFGLQAGRIVVQYKNISPWAMVKRWLFWGVTLAAVGTGLCGAYKNDGLLPLNKSMWSPAFIAVMAGTGYLFLGVMFMLVDYRRWWSGAPFLFVGKNSILIYCGSVILQNRFPFSFSDHSRSDDFKGTFMTHIGALASNIVGVTVWCIVAFLWHRHGFYVKV